MMTDDQLKFNWGWINVNCDSPAKLPHGCHERNPSICNCWKFVSLIAPGLSEDIVCVCPNSFLCSSKSPDQTSGIMKVGCQPGDCRWPLTLRSLCVGMYGLAYFIAHTCPQKKVRNPPDWCFCVQADITTKSTACQSVLGDYSLHQFWISPGSGRE